MNKLDVRKLSPDAILPTRANSLDAGLDLYANEDAFVPVNRTVKVKTGIAAHITPGYVGLIRDRSSMAAKGLVVGAGVIDAHYAGDLTVVLHNISNKTCDNERSTTLGYQINKGDKIAHLLIQKIELPEVQEVTHSWEVIGRGLKGWGSSGG